MTTLKPCPFCGGEAAVCDIKEPSVNGWVGCQMCRCFIDWVKDGKSLAIAAWNRRAEPENEPLTLDELRQMDGEAVWLSDIKNPECSGWHLANVNREDRFLIDRYGWKIPLFCLGEERPVYRYKPERSEG